MHCPAGPCVISEENAGLLEIALLREKRGEIDAVLTVEQTRLPRRLLPALAAAQLLDPRVRYPESMRDHAMGPVSRKLTPPPGAPCRIWLMVASRSCSGPGWSFMVPATAIRGRRCRKRPKTAASCM